MVENINYIFNMGDVFKERNHGVLKLVNRYVKKIPRTCRGKIYTKNQKRYCYECLTCGYHGDISEEDLKYQKTGCPSCSGRVALVGVTDMWTTCPDLAKNLKNKSDGYKYTRMSNEKVDWVCPSCHRDILQKSICNVNVHGLFCNQCSYGNSYPNKFISAFLNYFNVDFSTEKSFDWSKNLVNDPICKIKYYDFYIPEQNIVIEANGLQHYKKAIGKTRTLEQEQLNDSIKKELAISNGMKFFSIDCKESNCDYIFENIKNSELLGLLNINCTKSDLLQIIKNAEKSYVVDCYNKWMNGSSLDELCKYFKKSKNTIRTYIKKGQRIFEGSK